MTCVKVLKSSGEIGHRCYRKCQLLLLHKRLIIADTLFFSSKVISQHSRFGKLFTRLESLLFTTHACADPDILSQIGSEQDSVQHVISMPTQVSGDGT